MAYIQLPRSHRDYFNRCISLRWHDGLRRCEIAGANHLCPRASTRLVPAKMIHNAHVILYREFLAWVAKISRQWWRYEVLRQEHENELRAGGYLR